MPLRCMLFLLLLIGEARADGVSYLALMHPDFPCREALKVFRGVEAPALSLLWGTFGRDLSCYRRFISRHPDATVIIHFSNEACRRWGRCKAGELFKPFSIAKYNRRLISRPNRLRRRLNLRLAAIKRAIAMEGSGRARIILSAGLEDNLSCKAVKSLVKILREGWGYEILRNPMADTRRCGADLLELHGPKPNPHADVWSNDGINLYTSAADRTEYRPDVDAREMLTSSARKRAGTALLLYWFATSQGLSGGTQFIAPRQRSFVVDPGVVHILNKRLRRSEHGQHN